MLAGVILATDRPRPAKMLGQLGKFDLHLKNLADAVKTRNGVR